MHWNILTSPYPDKIDAVRYKAFVTYCLFQIGYSFFLVLYGFLVPTLLKLNVLTALILVPLLMVAIVLARKNYRLTAKVFVLSTFVAQSLFLVNVEVHINLNIAAFLVYLLISVLAFASLGRYWGICLFVLSIMSIGLNIYLGDYDLDRSRLPESKDGLFFHVAAYGTFLFVFVGYLLALFEKYMRLYLVEFNNSKDLNTKLEETIQSLNDVNCDLEEHVSAVSDANAKLAKYAWTHSHELRAPVARLLGLVNIFKIGTATDKNIVITSIGETANDLDGILIKMNYILKDVNVRDYNTEKT